MDGNDPGEMKTTGMADELMAGTGKNRAVLLDRDGVINVNRDDYVKSVDEFEMIPGAAAAVRSLNDAGFLVIVITNQSPLGRGIFDGERLKEINDHMRQRLKQEAGALIDDILFCPHRPDEGCGCRKPQPGMLLHAAELYQLDLSETYFVGDADSDREAAAAASCRFAGVGKMAGGRTLAEVVGEILETG